MPTVDDEVSDILSLFGTPPVPPDPFAGFSDAQVLAEATKRGLLPPTLAAAQQHIEDHLEKGSVCLVCGKNQRLYKRPLNDTMARGLIWLVREAGPGRDWVEVSKYGPKWLVKAGGEFAKLAHWGLIEEQPNPDDPSKKTSGIWRPRYKGVKFANNQIRVSRRVFLYRNVVRGWDDDDMSIIQCLGERFNYQALMDGTA